MRGHSKEKEAAHPPPWSTKGHSLVLQKWWWLQAPHNIEPTQHDQDRDGHPERGVLHLQDPAKRHPWALWSSTLTWPNFMGSSWERAKCGSPQDLASLCLQSSHQGTSHQEHQQQNTDLQVETCIYHLNGFCRKPLHKVTGCLCL